MYTEDFFFEHAKPIVSRALSEDLGSQGDISAAYCLEENRPGKAVLYARASGCIAGVRLAEYIYALGQARDDFHIERFKSDGDAVRHGDKLIEIHAGARLLLERERTVLNFMQRMSGIATYTQKLVSHIAHTTTRLLDTRKTAPGLRAVDKWAVAIGGGTNHRFGLYDAIMLKENHIDYAGGLTQAFQRLRQQLKQLSKRPPVIVEARDYAEFLEVKRLGKGLVDRILLDNFSPQEVALAAAETQAAFQLEASGGITEDNIAAYARAGVDFVSMGALTHTVQAFDISALCA